MRLRNIPGADEEIAASAFVVQEPGKMRGNWKEGIFGNGSLLHLEIGCGKGAFLMEQARRNPEISFIGMEKMSSVLLRAVQKQDEACLPNLRFVRLDAERLTECFDEAEVERIYLNFSDPWPKDRHAKRRLTSREFLKRYDRILSPSGRIEFKTDNPALFEFSLREAEESGWDLSEVTRDLYHSEYLEGNVMTEYEDRFVTLGNRIMRMVMTRRHT